MSFTALRFILSNEQFPYPWGDLLYVLENWETPEELSMAVDYLREHTADWPVDVCHIENRGVMFYHPAFPLAKSLLVNNPDSVDELSNYLERLPQLARLEKLQVKHHFFSPEMSAYLKEAFSLSAPHSRLLSFTLSAFSNEVGLIESIPTALCLQNVEHLHLGWQWLSQEDCRWLGNPEVLPRLRSLSLEQMNVYSQGWNQLFEGERKRSLESLELFDFDEEEAEEMLYVFCKKHPYPSLETLKLSEVYLDDFHFNELLADDNFPSLQALDVSNNQLTRNAITHLSRHPQKKLKNLNLNYNNLENDGLSALATLPSCQNLTSLHLNDVSVSNDGVLALLESPFFTNIEELHFKYNYAVSGEVWQQLLSSSAFPKLKVLELSWHELEPEFLEALKQDSRVRFQGLQR